MKIVIYTNVFAPVVGGIQTLVIELAQGLATCVKNQGERLGKMEIIVATPTPGGGLSDSDFPFRVVRQPSVLKLFSLFYKADVIHLAGPSIFQMFLGALLRKPLVVEHDGYQAICPSGNYIHQPDGTVCPGHFYSRNYAECYKCQLTESSPFHSAWNLLMLFPRRWLAKRVAANIASSNHTGKRIMLPRTQTIYHGIQSVDPSQTPDHRSGETLTFAYVGRLVPEKGVAVLLAAADEARKAGCNFRLRIIGDGPERGRLEELAASLQLSGCIEFLGYRTGSELEAALADVSVVVMPSQWEEACPLSAIEQMMQGRLLIATDIGALSELVADVGLKFPLGNASALATCIRQALNEPRLVQSLVGAARLRAMRLFSGKNMTLEHLNLYEQLVQGKG